MSSRLVSFLTCLLSYSCLLICIGQDLPGYLGRLKVLQGFPSAFSHVLNSQYWLFAFLRIFSLSLSPFFPSAPPVLSILEEPFMLSIMVYLGIQVGKAVFLLCSEPPVWSSQPEKSAEYIFGIQISGWLLHVAVSLCCEAWPVSSVCLSVHIGWI